MSQRKNLIRVGSWVRIVDPRVLIRVGYPNSLAHYMKEAEQKWGQYLDGIFDGRDPYTRHGERIRDRMLRELAKMIGDGDGWGGNVRSLHLEDRPELVGHEGRVSGLRSVVTGVYQHGSRSGYPDPEEYDPPYLSKQWVHRIATLTIPAVTNPGFEIPVAHLELVKPEGEE